MPSFKDRARQASSLTELNGLFGREVRAYGFDAYVAGYLPGSETEDPIAERAPFLLLDWPADWLELYARQGFVRDDAVIAAARQATTPITWRELQAQQPGASARIFAAASTSDGTTAFSFPSAAGRRAVWSAR